MIGIPMIKTNIWTINPERCWSDWQYGLRDFNENTLFLLFLSNSRSVGRSIVLSSFCDGSVKCNAMQYDRNFSNIGMWTYECCNNQESYIFVVVSSFHILLINISLIFGWVTLKKTSHIVRDFIFRYFTD